MAVVRHNVITPYQQFPIRLDFHHFCPGIGTELRDGKTRSDVKSLITSAIGIQTHYKFCGRSFIRRECPYHDDFAIGLNQKILNQSVERTRQKTFITLVPIHPNQTRHRNAGIIRYRDDEFPIQLHFRFHKGIPVQKVLVPGKLPGIPGRIFLKYVLGRGRRRPNNHQQEYQFFHSLVLSAKLT